MELGRIGKYIAKKAEENLREFAKVETAMNKSF